MFLYLSYVEGYFTSYPIRKGISRKHKHNISGNAPRITHIQLLRGVETGRYNSGGGTLYPVYILCVCVINTPDGVLGMYMQFTIVAMFCYY